MSARRDTEAEADDKENEAPRNQRTPAACSAEAAEKPCRRAGRRHCGKRRSKPEESESEDDVSGLLLFCEQGCFVAKPDIADSSFAGKGSLRRVTRQSPPTDHLQLFDISIRHPLPGRRQVEAILEADREAKMKASNLFEDGPCLNLKLKTMHVKPLPPRAPMPARNSGSPASDSARSKSSSPAPETPTAAEKSDVPTKKRRKVGMVPPDRPRVITVYCGSAFALRW